MMTTKEAYERKLQAQLDLWNADIQRLKAKAEIAAADAQINHEATLEELRQYQRDAQEKLKELQESGESAWGDMKSGVESAWAQLEQAMKAARSRFE